MAVDTKNSCTADPLPRQARPHGHRSRGAHHSTWCSTTARGTPPSSRIRRPTRWLKFEQTIIALDPESVFPRTGPQRGEREMAIEELAALAASWRRAASRRTTRSWRSTRSSPCRSRASCSPSSASRSAPATARTASSPRSCSASRVIFAYYVIMFTAQSLTKGVLDPGVARHVDPEPRPRRGGRVPAGRDARDRPISRFASRCRRGCRRRLSSDEASAPAASGGHVRQGAGAGDPHPAFLDAGAERCSTAMSRASTAASSP